MSDTSAISFRTMASQSDADAFRSLNEEWISLWFRLEEKDIATLANPQGAIIAPGGQVYIASQNGAAVGTAALIRYGDGVYELSKMAISPAARGKGIGRQLILFVLEQARAMGARTVFLGSSKRLANAVHLYESVGFRHVPPSALPPMKYDRADVFMAMEM